jgi:soluble lytic murein transglycosylase-like protein
MVLAVAPAASAQIYMWRDAKGNIVLSDRSPNGTARSYETPRGNAPYRSTRPAEAPFRGRYDEIIEKHAVAYSVSPDLVRAVVQVESGFNPYARSPRGAMGLMQLMPDTAIEMGVVDPYDPDQNIRGGVAYLRQLLNRYAGDLTLALAAYNAGPAAVDRVGYAVPPFRETRDYVARVKSGSKGAVTVIAGHPAPSSPLAAKSAAAKPAATHRLYKTVEIINGRPVPRYSDTKPTDGPYEVVSRR